jgi:glycosyltransferase involved in cell wall biosynthesis
MTHSSADLAGSVQPRATTWRQIGVETLVPRRLVWPESWAGHIPFAFWIIAAHRPRLLVELGVHTGNSYCAFNQAVAHLGLPTRSLGIDHWLGDPQAGFYGEDVYNALRAHHDPLYGAFSTLLRMSFADGRAHAADASVDLLHIDGLHTYDAVREDFETWRDKMSDRGLVLLHDTTVHHGDFGVWKFWEEIAARYPAFEFDHSNGLGVAYVGTAPIKNPDLAALFAAGDGQERDTIRRYFTCLGEGWIAHIQRDRALREWDRMRADVAAIENDRATLRRERDALRERIPTAERWNDLALHCHEALGLDVEVFATVVRRLYNSANPDALRDRHVLNRLLTRIHRERSCGYVRLEPPRYQVALESRVLSHFRPAPPALEAEAEEPQPDPLAPIRNSGLFDETFYGLSAEARARGQDPLEHYLEEGEDRGIAPSALFEPAYYGRRNPDVRTSGLGLLRHFVLFGRNEGRHGVSPATRMTLPTLEKSSRERVLLVLHEASRTGAPILGWNVAQGLRKRHEVIVVLRKGGPLREAFEREAFPLIDLPEDAALFQEDLEAIGRRLATELNPAYAIANSAETRPLIGPLSRAGVGTIALVHEFSVDVRPQGEFHDFLVWAHRLIFPARIVATSFAHDHPYLTQRRREILAQGIPALPPRVPWHEAPEETGAERLRPPGHEKDFLVVGMGRVQFRKGVDLFVSMAARVVQHRPDAPIRFVWIGDGYSPTDPTEFPTYLTDQLARAGLGKRLTLAGEFSDLIEVFATADVLVLTSRLDPMPNTSVEALSRGLPVICFDKASGIAEILSEDADTRDLVVPYLDTAAMARLVVDLEADPERRERLGRAGQAVAKRYFDMDRYVATLDAWGRATQAEVATMKRDQAIIEAAEVFDAAFYSPPGDTCGDGSEATVIAAYLLRYRLTGPGSGNEDHMGLRRPLPGFNPLAYAEATGTLDSERDPLALWLEAERPDGPWLHPVLDTARETVAPPEDAGVLLHAHFHYVDLAPDFLERLAGDGLACDLVLTTTDEDRAIALRRMIEPRANSRDCVRVVPNRGRDIGALLTGLSDLAQSDYRIIGHVHGKKSVHLGDGDRWRNFLWENLIGGRARAASAAVSALSADPGLGVIFPEDPNLCGWDLNKDIATDLARRMGRTAPLPRFPDWPNGTMFWARQEALAPLFALGLSWADYPEEPVPVDGTVLHALERLIPFAAEQAGLNFATTRLRGVNR